MYYPSIANIYLRRYFFSGNFPKYLRLIIDLIPFHLFGLTKLTISTTNKGKSRIDRL